MKISVLHFFLLSTAALGDVKDQNSWPSIVRNLLPTGHPALYVAFEEEAKWNRFVTAVGICPIAHAESFTKAIENMEIQQAELFGQGIEELLQKLEGNAGAFCKYMEIFSEMIYRKHIDSLADLVTPDNVIEKALERRDAGVKRTLEVDQMWLRGAHAVMRAEKLLAHGDKGTRGFAPDLAKDVGFEGAESLPAYFLTCTELIDCYFEVQEIVIDRKPIDYNWPEMVKKDLDKLELGLVGEGLIEQVADFKGFASLLAKISTARHYFQDDQLLKLVLQNAAQRPAFALLADISIRSGWKSIEQDLSAILKKINDSEILALCPLGIVLPNEHSAYLRERFRSFAELKPFIVNMPAFLPGVTAAGVEYLVRWSVNHFAKLH